MPGLVSKDTVARIIQYLTAKEPYQVSLEEYLNQTWLHNSENNTWQVKKFATNLKKIVSLLTGISLRDLEKQEVKQNKLPAQWYCWKLSFIAEHNDIDHLIWKVFSTEDEAREYMDDRYIVGGVLEEYLPTYREFLQILGTDLFRKKLHPDTWINSLFSEYVSSYANNPWYADKDIFSVSEHDELLHEPMYPKWLISDLRFSNEYKRIKQEGGICVRVERKTDLINNHESETQLDNHQFDWIIDNNKDIPSLVKEVELMLNYYKIPYQ